MKLKTVKKADHCSITFGEWFDRVNGNTYYDAEVWIDDKCWHVAYCYGYNAPDQQAVSEALKEIGYKLRTCAADHFRPFNEVRTTCYNKLKRELFKTTKEVTA